MRAVKLTLSPDCQGAKVCDTCGLMTQYVYALAARTERSSTRFDAGKPVGNADAEFLVLLPEFSALCRLFRRTKAKNVSQTTKPYSNAGTLPKSTP
jgi:hypothetical protein